MNKKYDIVAIGTMAYDMILRTVDESAFTRDTTILSDVGTSPGGGALIQAAVASRLGCRTALVGKVTADAFSRYLMDILEADGVDTSAVKISPEDVMSLTFALVRPDGARHFLGRMGSNNQSLRPADFDLDLVRQAKVVSYGSLLVLKGMDKEIPEIFRAAKEAGAITVADIANDSFGQGPEVVFACFPWLDYFVPSEVEAQYLTGETEPEKMAAALHAKGCRNLVIKLGDQGCYASTPKDARFIPGFHVTSVDSTGAGDNFVGGFLAALAAQLPLYDALRFANAVGAVSVTAPGGLGALKNKQQVWDLMGDNSAKF